MMSTTRELTTVYTPEGHPGFMGEGHIAKALIQTDYAQSDPFILLMDDMLDKKDDEPAGGPHPHAGFETVTLMLEGKLGDHKHQMQAGDLQKMTAGSGIIHTETITEKTRMRLLQLWLTLPKKDRWVAPKVQDISASHVPAVNNNGWSAKVYAGSFAGMTSPVELYTPIIIADINLEPGTTIEQTIPLSFNGFLYMLEGSVLVGNDQAYLNKDQVGWFNKTSEEGESKLLITAGNTDTRFVLYAGQPQGDPIVSHGPFIADTRHEISELFHRYSSGKMQHISTVAPGQQIVW